MSLTNRDKIRLLVGDTDVDPDSDAVLSDEEIDDFLEVRSVVHNGSTIYNVYAAAADTAGAIAGKFARDGFDARHSALVGYPLDGRVQLLSGTHRHEAAHRAHIRLPVRILPRSVVEALWGTPEWAVQVGDVPVPDLGAMAGRGNREWTSLPLASRSWMSSSRGIAGPNPGGP